MTRRRLAGLTVLAVVLGIVAACGGGSRAPKVANSVAPGKAANSVAPGKAAGLGSPGTTAGGVAGHPGQADQASGASVAQLPAPGKRVNEDVPTKAVQVNPCRLVTKAEAQTALGVQLTNPQELPLGPTCVYKSADASTFVTLGVEHVDFNQIKPNIQNLTRVDGLPYQAYCGTYGRPQLYVVLSSNSLLDVVAKCDVATQLAAKAVARL